jgi:hypothetical protein
MVVQVVAEADILQAEVSLVDLALDHKVIMVEQAIMFPQLHWALVAVVLILQEHQQILLLALAVLVSHQLSQARQ